MKCEPLMGGRYIGIFALFPTTLRWNVAVMLEYKVSERVEENDVSLWNLNKSMEMIHSFRKLKCEPVTSHLYIGKFVLFPATRISNHYCSSGRKGLKRWKFNMWKEIFYSFRKIKLELLTTSPFIGKFGLYKGLNKIIFPAENSIYQRN